MRRDFLDRVPDGDIPFQVPKDAAKLITDFAKDSSRSGGIVAPDIVADGLSREHGPVNVDGMLARAGATLDPKRLLGEGANLLGYSLADLIDETRLTTPPAILHGVSASGTPVVTFKWSQVALATDTGSFVTDPDSTLDLDVSVGAEGQTITCTVSKVALRCPTATPRRS